MPMHVNRKPIPLNPCIKSLALDLDIFNDIVFQSDRIYSKLEQASQFFDAGPSLFADLYLALFKEHVELCSLSPSLSPSKQLQYGIIKHILTLDAFEALKNSCTLSYFNSLLGAELIGGEIIQQLHRMAKKDPLVPQSLIDLKQPVSSFLEHLCDYRFFHTSLTEAQTEFNRLVFSIKTWGLDDGTLTSTSYEEKIHVSLKLRTNPKVHEIAEMVGRFKMTASQLQQRRTKEEGFEMCGVQLGAELHKALPSERLLLTDTRTKRHFLKKLSQRELMSYKYKNSRSKSKGPILCCIDTSSSMAGEREIWSKAVALTLLEIAIQQKRDFAAILYSNKVYRVIEFHKGHRPPQQIYELATYFYGSGTNFVEPLRESLNLIRKAKYKYADIVFITDGEASIDDEFIETFLSVKEKKDFHMITINVADQFEASLELINDRQILLKNLTETAIEETNTVIFDL